MNRIIRTPKAPVPKASYSQAVVSGGVVFVSGQVAIHPETNEIEHGTLRSETERIFDNIQTILAEAGCGMKDVVRVGVYLADLKDFAEMNKIYANYFPENPPARTTIAAGLLGVKIEIDCIAKVPD